MGFDKNNKEGCVKTPTRCLIWTGGKVHCIVSEDCAEISLEELIVKIGCKLKDIYKEISISDIDFLDLLAEKECPPENLSGLIQIIINKVLETAASSNSNSVENSSLVISVADCFISVAGSETLPIDEYVSFLGVQMCSMLGTIEQQNQLIEQMQQQMQAMQASIDALTGG